MYRLKINNVNKTFLNNPKRYDSTFIKLAAIPMRMNMFININKDCINTPM